MEDKKGKLYIISTPIGNMEDITFRAINILNNIDVLACEDTRHTRNIFVYHNIAKPEKIISYHEYNEKKAVSTLLDLMKNNKTIALASDAGTPGISDPGYRIISAARDTGYDVEVIPGPNAVTTALISSGLPCSSFTFKGFAPRKKGQRKQFLEIDKELPHTLIIFESPYRIGSFIQDAFEILGNRLAAVCIEMTKKFERIYRGYLEELAEKFRDKKEKGEITIVISGNNRKFIK